VSAFGFVIGGYGRLSRVKDRAPCLCGPYAAVEIRLLVEQFSKWPIGSGPRGRRFKSYRPDQFSENLSKSAEFSLVVHSVLMRKSGHENRVLRTSNGGLPWNCSTFPAAGSVRALVGPRIGLKPLCSPYADQQHPPSLPPHVHGWKTGAVLKIDRSGYTPSR
jgi:hypothetical protein